MKVICYCCWLLANGCWLLVAGYWLLVTGYWLLVTGCWLLATGYWLLVTGYWLLVSSLKSQLSVNIFYKNYICIKCIFVKSSCLWDSIQDYIAARGIR